ncbi:hypothetical protein TgHK011_007134 [Trichoderma gracile]|nr:hypothetical protein TgHK011_007134 [Trichoderma gracile]
MHPDRPSHTRSPAGRPESGEEGLASGVSWTARAQSSDKPGHVPSTAVPAPEPRRHAVIRLNPQGLVSARRGRVSSMASTSVSHHIDSLEAAIPAVACEAITSHAESHHVLPTLWMGARLLQPDASRRNFAGLSYAPSRCCLQLPGPAKRGWMHAAYNESLTGLTFTAKANQPANQDRKRRPWAQHCAVGSTPPTLVVAGPCGYQAVL